MLKSIDLFQAAKDARKLLRANGHKFDRLLSSPQANPKLEKSNTKLAVMTAPLHLAPAKLSGFEVCPKATDGCRAGCLHTAGNPAFMQGKHASRIDKTKAYFSNRNAFMLLLAYDIAKLCEAAEKAKLQPGIRLNATSDIPWESVSFEANGTKHKNLMTAFPKAQFYDYSKRPNRKNVPANYHLTFSLAENNDTDAIKALGNGFNVAVVFNVNRTQPLPTAYPILGREISVIDGDLHDYRPIDPCGVIVGLRAKGQARKDKSGFVRKVTV